MNSYVVVRDREILTTIPLTGYLLFPVFSGGLREDFWTFLTCFSSSFLLYQCSMRNFK